MDRRSFLKTGCYGVTLFTTAGLIPPLPRRAVAASLSFAITAEAVVRTLIDGSVLSAWQFTGGVNGAGPGALGAGLVVRSGDIISVALTNVLAQAINVTIPGVLENTPACPPGATQIYQFTAPAAGSYYVCDALPGDIGRAMGLFAPLIVMPADGGNRLNAGGALFDKQYTLVLHEADDRLNAAIVAGQAYAMADYEPNYFFINGLSYPDTSARADTAIAMTVGQTIALRIINPGLIYNPLHFHGYHVQVISRNRSLETAVVDKDTVSMCYCLLPKVACFLCTVIACLRASGLPASTDASTRPGSRTDPWRRTYFHLFGI